MKLSNGSFVLQVYKKRPLLIDDKKTDIRVFVLITRLDPLEVYICEEGFVHYAKDKYEEIN